MNTSATHPRTKGRPPMGPGGTKVADLPAINTRATTGALEALGRLCTRLRLPAWQVVSLALVDLDNRTGGAP